MKNLYHQFVCSFFIKRHDKSYFGYLPVLLYPIDALCVVLLCFIKLLSHNTLHGVNGMKIILYSLLIVITGYRL